MDMKNKWIVQCNLLYYFIHMMRDYDRRELERLVEVSRN